MRSTKMIAASTLVVAAAASGLASAQPASVTNLPAGRLYVTHSAAGGGCPAVDWHVVVGPNNTLEGMVSWNNMQSMAKVSGDVKNNVVHMTGKEVGGKERTATVTGTLRPDGWIFADIKGATVDCKGVAIPYFAPPPGGAGGSG